MHASRNDPLFAQTPIAMKLPDFLTSYRKQSHRLLAQHDEATAMSLAVGGDFETVGVLEFCLLKSLGLRPEQTVVDVGCGSGRLAVQLKDYLSGRYVGLDVVPELHAYARRRCARQDWSFQTATGTVIPEPDRSADFVVFFSVFTHLTHEQTYRYLREAKRVLRPGGTIVFSFLEFALPTHWFIFEHSVADDREDKVLNQFMDRDMIHAFSAHLDLHVERIVDGHIPSIPLDRSIRWADGRESSGMGELGQSICSLKLK